MLTSSVGFALAGDLAVLQGHIIDSLSFDPFALLRISNYGNYDQNDEVAGFLAVVD